MLWRYGFIIAGLLVLTPTTAQPQIITNGESLKQRCDTFQLTMPAAGLGCRGYIGAVADILADGNTIYDYRACPPPGKKREALIKTAKKWLENHSAAMNRSASALIAQALAEVYSCATE